MARIPKIVLDVQRSPVHAALVSLLLTAMDALLEKRSGFTRRALLKNNGVLTVSLETKT